MRSSNGGCILENKDKELCERQYVESVKEKMRFFVIKELVNPIDDYQTISNWVDQFPEDSVTPYFLLDTLIILTRKQVEASIRNIFEQIKAKIYVSNPNLSDKMLFAKYEEHLEKSVFISACMPGQTAGGAPETIRALRTVIEDKFNEISVPEVCQRITNGSIDHVYIVDDFIGTGNTICKILKHEYLCDACSCGQGIKKCSLQCALNHQTNVEFTVISVVLHKAGEKLIKDSFKNIKILSAFTIDESYDLLSDACELYRDADYIEQIISEVRSIMDEHHMDENPFALHLPIGISGAFPNNSLELFWWSDSTEWKPLVRRLH